MPTPAEITDPVVPEAEATGPRPVDPKREYVSGGHWSWMGPWRRSLPQYIDELGRDFGDDIYERMLKDAQVESCVELLKKAILSGGIRLLPAVGEDDPRYEQAVEIADFCQRNLDRLERPTLREVLLNMLDALAFGNKVAEQIYEVVPAGPDAGRLMLKALKVKPRRAVAFVVDAYLNVVGLLALLPATGSTITGGMVANPANLLPRRKFAVLTHQGKDGDPRGTSILRSSYHPWWVKQQVWVEYLKWLAQFGSPSLIGTLPPTAQPMPKLDETGQPLTDGNGRPILEFPADVMLENLQAVRSGSVAVLPAGATAKTLEGIHVGSQFESAIALCDLQIAKGILNQTLATEQAQHQARAASSTHQDILGLVIGDGKTMTAAMLRADVCAPLVEYNFPAEQWDLVPQVTLAETEQQDFAAVAAAIAQLARAGYIAESQKPGIDALLNLPERTEPEGEAAGQPEPVVGEEDGEDEDAPTR